MAQNYFTDYPERWDQLKKYSSLSELALPLEEVWGEKGFYKNKEEAMETFETILGEIGKLCGGEIRANAGDVDKAGCKFNDGEVTLPDKLVSNLERCKELGVFAGGISRKAGGMNFPRAIQAMTLEMFGQACPNTGLSIANYSMGSFFEKLATPEQKEKYLAKIRDHEYLTSMALTEPQAGSDLGKLRTSAKKEGDHWLVNGTKLFISGGHAHVCFALVRTDAKSTGLNGLSVLLIPKNIEGASTPNFKVAKIEDKVCLHASPTCELLFENSVGYMFGPENEGFKVMLELMNEARLAMAALSVGLATGCLNEAKEYAKTRITMGKPIIQHPMIADMLYEMEIEIRAMRAMVVEASNAYDWMFIAKEKGDQKNFKKWKKRYRRLTPLAKYYCAEKSITIAKNAMQIFGGYGVCKEYPVERLLRETLIYPIYEGTSQIQSLMVLKDTLKDVAQQAGGFLGSLAGAWAESLVTRDPVKQKLLQARNELNQGINLILKNIIKDKFKSDVESLKQQKIQDFLKDFSLQLLSAKTDLSFPFLWAERFTRITCDYYALKCMADNLPAEDQEYQKWILEFANLALPRMGLENHYMVHRQPSTMEYMKKFM